MNSTNLNKPTPIMNTSPYLLLLIFPFASLWANQGLDDLNRQMQVDELQWQIDETKRSADEAAHEARKVQEQLKKQQEQEWYQRNARDPMDPIPATVEGQSQRVREKREADELAQAQREADQVNARIKCSREMQAIEERNRVEAERLKQDEQEQLENIHTYLEQSKSVALKRYPQLIDMDSDMMKLMIKIDDYWKASAHPLYHSLDKPLILAEIAAVKLNIKPADE